MMSGVPVRELGALRGDSYFAECLGLAGSDSKHDDCCESKRRSLIVGMTLGIDLACRAAHVASLAGPDGTLVWRGRSFFTRPADLEKLWRDLACDARPS